MTCVLFLQTCALQEGGVVCDVVVVEARQVERGEEGLHSITDHFRTRLGHFLTP